MALTLGTTLVMVGFWRALHDEAGDRGSWQMALGASIALLAKGPVALILCGVPIVVWALLAGKVFTAWRRIAWLGVAALVLAASLPWYLVAEARTPGFLHYFIVGEHWHRFVTPGWRGDLYGSAHEVPHGSIWLYALGAVLPWSVLAPLTWLIARQRDAVAGAAMRKAEASYLWAWALAPCLFFTFAGNILWTYVLPGLPALAILAGHWTATRQHQGRVEGVMTLGIVVGCIALIGLLISAEVSGRFDERSAKSLIGDYQVQGRPEQALYFLGRVPFSGSFYTHGKARTVADVRDLPAGQPAYLILDKETFDALAPDARARLEPKSTRGGRVLARVQ
jgi:4-amino-4-deoxy-L-arabinose transferase-like glycosyltransferase